MILHMKGAAESKVQSEHGCSESGSGSSSSVLCRQASKVVDASNMDIVFRGKVRACVLLAMRGSFFG